MSMKAGMSCTGRGEPLRKRTPEKDIDACALLDSSTLPCCCCIGGKAGARQVGAM